MKARTVSGLKPGRTLEECAARIVAVRMEEMLDLAFKALEPDAVKRQHDMRIAAKRLRYALEMTGMCLGDVADEGLAAAKALQQVLGDVHDCDEMDVRANAHLIELRAADVAVVRGAAGKQDDLGPELAVYAPNRNLYRGVSILIVYLQARRTLLFERFAELWAAQLEDGVWDQLASAADEALDRGRQTRKSNPKSTQ